MARLEDLTRGAQVKGVRNDGPVEVVDAKWFGTSAIELTYKDAQGKPGNELLYRTDEPTARGRRPRAPPGASTPTATSSASSPRPTASGSPTSSTRSSPSTPASSSRCRTRSRPSTARCCPRQPLRFLLADDPGAGKTIMAGLFIKELMVRGDLKRCLDRLPRAASSSSGRTS